MLKRPFANFNNLQTELNCHLINKKNSLSSVQHTSYEWMIKYDFKDFQIDCHFAFVGFWSRSKSNLHIKSLNCKKKRIFYLCSHHISNTFASKHIPGRQLTFSLYKRERRKDRKQIREALLKDANTMGRTDIQKCFQEHLQKDTCTSLLACTLTKKDKHTQ